MVVLPPRMNKEIGNELCILVGINPELSQFLNFRVNFLLKYKMFDIYIGFFRYGHVRFHTNINPQVPVFDINREPVPTPNEYPQYMFFMEKSAKLSLNYHQIPSLSVLLTVLQMVMRNYGRQISVKINHGTFQASPKLCQLIRVIYVALSPVKRLTPPSTGWPQ